ncbi:MAG: hypothetical protein WBG50_23430 [Desulfomonilaceae bacterium]
MYYVSLIILMVPALISLPTGLAAADQSTTPIVQSSARVVLAAAAITGNVIPPPINNNIPVPSLATRMMPLPQLNSGGAYMGLGGATPNSSVFPYPYERCPLGGFSCAFAPGTTSPYQRCPRGGFDCGL